VIQPFINFAQKQIIITGANGGIGSTLARLLDSLNATLVLVGRDEKRLHDFHATLSGKQHQYCAIDLTDIDSIKPRLLEKLNTSKGVYGFCHCAGVVQFRPLNATKREVLAAQMLVNLESGLEICKLVTHRTHAAQEGGSIVFVSSITAVSGSAGQVAYCASKGAVNAAVRALAIEMAPRNIKVNSVSPGALLNDMTQQKSGLTEAQIEAILEKYPLPHGSELAVARAIAFLLAPENQWITGVDLKVDGGFCAQ
jgi:NAD(P)-dependent dehydrogenase (short-subunit alcohol dehydrogenase family)